MKTVVLFMAALTGSFVLPAQDVKLKITHLTGDFYIYTTYNNFNGTPFPSNSMYVVTSKGIVLFDTPWDTTQFQPLLDSLEARHHQKPVLCISTHFHDDRTAGLDFLKQHGVATWSSVFTQQLCAAHHFPQAAHTFSKDTTFTVGNHRFTTFYPGEGHSRDNIVIWFHKEKILYGGCFIKSTDNNSLGNVADANVKAWPESVRKAMQRFKQPAYVIPGHFSWTNNRSLQHTLHLLEQASRSK